MSRFIKKKDAIYYYDNLKNKKQYKLFEEDIDKAGSKCFYVATTKYIFNQIYKENISHYYEFWAANTKLLFSIDVDYYRTKDNIDPYELLIKIINIVIAGAKKYYDYEYKISNIIILENLENNLKYSSHIIFRGLSFYNYLVVKDFYTRLDKEYKIKTLHTDKSIYNLTCLRLYGCSKMSANNVLYHKQLKINNEYTMIPNNDNTKETFFNFFEKTMITNTNDSIKTIKEIKTNKIVNNNINNDDISNINIENILDKLPSPYYDDYNTWINIGMILYNYNMFDLWNKWSSKSHKYKESEMISKWNSFKNSKYNIGTLIHYAKIENIDNIYKEDNSIKSIVELYPSKPINIDLTIYNEYTILSQEKLEPEIYKSIIDKKLIAVQSEKGTGKTSNLFKVLFNENNNNSILFISSRVTFGYKLLGDLKKYGFELYSQIKDTNIQSKKIICQIDSLLRLDNEYDIVIVDECETLARYMTSSHFTKNPKANLIISSFESYITEAKKIFILDADLSDRCMNYYKQNIILDNNNDYHLIINTYKPFKDYKILYSKYETWLRQILLKIENNNKLVIAMTSNKKAKDLKKLLDEKFTKNILLIHKESSDEEKLKLLRVNDEWIKYDIVIYTPSVCMGVSFDEINYFDYIFAYGCHESLGSQEFFQMIHRVRNPKYKEIYVTIDIYKKFEQNEDIINYKTVEKIVCSDYYLTHYELHTNILQKKIIKKSKLDNGIEEDDLPVIGSITENDKIIYYPYKNEPIYDLYIRNSLELIENRLNFTACFFGYAKYKEYQLEFLQSENADKNIIKEIKEINELREEEEKNKLIDGIFNAKDIDNDEYLEKIKLRDEYIEDKDIYEINRYKFKKCYNIKEDIITYELLYNYYDKKKMKWYYNLSTILSTDNMTTEEKIDIIKNNDKYYELYSDSYKNIIRKYKYSYHYYPLEIIKIFNFNINDLSIEIKNTDYITKLYDAIAFCDKNKESIANKYSIKSLTYDLTELSDIAKIKYINNILETHYGLKIKRCYQNTDIDKCRYKLDNNSIWDEFFNNSETIKKIIPIEIKDIKNINNNDYNTINLDLFIETD